MRYLTARKRAEGKGASGTGTEHHWFMQVSAVGLAFMIPVWVYIFGSTLGKPHAEVVATFARPFPAILTGLVNTIVMAILAMVLGITLGVVFAVMRLSANPVLSNTAIG